MPSQKLPCRWHQVAKAAADQIANADGIENTMAHRDLDQMHRRRNLECPCRTPSANTSSTAPSLDDNQAPPLTMNNGNRENNKTWWLLRCPWATNAYMNIAWPTCSVWITEKINADVASCSGKCNDQSTENSRMHCKQHAQDAQELPSISKCFINFKYTRIQKSDKMLRDAVRIM